ncbi:uncharacterized protein LOC125495182 [Beta vulgaris subsp. vulgaris]|uniref:uncharacterized protein LOC125495182 n=1 Tax=Beta vulgaris subsp. vulgaris TaxID=3555 RepID=UPI002036CE8D|nr:uncharacterized protein LOC125495182 [Beta vulgaris subsp. vulgaris]
MFTLNEIMSGFEELPLLLPKPEVDIHLMSREVGSYVLWPCALVQFSDEVLGKTGSHDRKAKKACSPDKKASLRDEAERNVLKANVSCALILETEVLRGLTIPCF